jgi:hypothetical protein
MKYFKKISKIILTLSFFILILWSILYFFKVIFKVEGEARLVEMSLSGETSSIKFYFDELSSGKLKWKDGLFLKGWVFKENAKSENREVFLVLKSIRKSIVFKIQNANIIRPDVSAAFHLVGNKSNYGFELFVPLYLLKENIYQVGFVIMDETGKHYTMSSQKLRIYDGAVTVNNSQPVSISLKAPTIKIKYFFDKIHISGNNLTVNGWGFLEGMNSDSLETYLLLKKNETVTMFSIFVQKRVDVTTYYRSSGLNFDSSGFLALIPVENLEQGRYQLGLYITMGSSTGLIYSDNYININHVY